MYQVIIERPRGGAGWGRDWPRTHWRDLDRDDANDNDDDAAANDDKASDGHRLRDGGPKCLRMGPRHRSKWLSENLAPLRRYLASQVGRLWDDVYSEISAHITLSSAVQKHVLFHLRQYVETNPVMIDGWPHDPRAYGRSGAGYRPLSARGNDFYVCPETRRLLLPRKPRPGKDHIVRPLDAMTALHCIRGVWFLVHLAPLPTDWKEHERCYDVLLKQSLRSFIMTGPEGRLAQTYGRRDVYAVRKEQPRAQVLPGLLRRAERYAAALLQEETRRSRSPPPAR